MTPTLMGRWQTRLLLLTGIGVPVTLFYSIVYGLLLGNWWSVWLFLFGVLIFGLGWDVLYNLLQQTRWDHDWPPFAQWAAAIWEAIFIYLVHLIFVLLGGAFVGPIAFILHYFTIFSLLFAANHSIMRILFPRWRFRGGQIL
ncbi:MAG: hypothetical protein ACFB51_19815 [Anaerolineae bacterium]